MVPEPFIRIFATINRAQFESINEKYKGQQLIKDITSKLGGDFELAVLTMCADKYEFLAKKVEKFLKGYSADKDGLCRYDFRPVFHNNVFFYIIMKNITIDDY